MIDAIDSRLPLLWAGILPPPGDVAMWAVGLAAFGLGWTVSRFSRSRAGQVRPVACQPAIPGYRAAQAAFTRELDSVRRYGRPMAVLVLKLEEPRLPEGSADAVLSNGDAPPADVDAIVRAAREVMFWNIGYALADLMRGTDIAACDAVNRRYVVVLPQAGDDRASLAAARLEQGLAASVGVNVRIGVSAYQVDGLTVDDLVRVATEKCDRGATVRSAPQVLRIVRASSARASDSRS